MLIIAGRTVGGPVLPEIEEMESELAKVIEDFDRAVNVEALHLAKNIGKHSFLNPATVFSVFSCGRARAFA
jgi:hypothetical protein